MSKNLKIAISVILILSFGLTTIWSTAPKLFLTQVVILVLGLGLLFIFRKLDLGVLFSLSPYLYIFSLLILVLTIVIGSTSRGATRWLGPLQTSEMIKPFLVIFFAYLLSNRPLKNLKNLVLFVLAVAVPALLVKAQPDLGSALVILATAGFMAIFSGLNLKIIALGLVGFLILVPLAPKLLRSYQMDRIQSFLNPHEDPQGRGYNAAQAVIAIGSGGLIGKGVRLGTQSHLNFLPERHTDFIFASFAEEFGLIGVFLLLAAYFYLISIFLNEAPNLKNPQYRLLLLGIVGIFITQTSINIGMNLGLLPVTGITLPLFSYGGSSLLSFMALLGLTVNLLELAPKYKI